MRAPGGHSRTLFPFFVFPYFRVHDDAISVFPAQQQFPASGTRRIAAISRRELRAFPGRASGFRRNRPRRPRIPHARFAVARLPSGVRRRPGCGRSAARPRPRRASPAPGLARAGPRPRHVRPGQPHPAWPGTPHRAPAGTRTSPGGHPGGRAPVNRHASEPPGTLTAAIQLHMITAPATPTIVLQAWTCISLGVHRKVQIGHYRGIRGVRAFQSQQVSRMEYGLADGKEPRPVCRDPI
jgi:hypothetical protein